MANINIEALKKNTFDTIVIGSGMSGGWAAKEFCEKGLKTLVVERGRDVKHVTDYPTAMKNPWEFDHRGQLPLAARNQYPPNSRTSFLREEVQHWALKPNEQPYIEEHPFQWTRGYHVGGKSLLNAWNQVHSCKNVFVTDGLNVYYFNILS
jgi:choline dehydrogenase-like flavoprotein